MVSTDTEGDFSELLDFNMKMIEKISRITIKYFHSFKPTFDLLRNPKETKKIIKKAVLDY